MWQFPQLTAVCINDIDFQISFLKFIIFYPCMIIAKINITVSNISDYRVDENQ